MRGGTVLKRIHLGDNAITNRYDLVAAARREIDPKVQALTGSIGCGSLAVGSASIAVRLA